MFTSTSTQACREINTYKWDFGDGTTEVLDKPEIKHTYSEGGVYSVILTVFDDEGKYDSIEKEITVEDINEEPSSPEDGMIQGTVLAKGEVNTPVSDALVRITPSQSETAVDFLDTTTNENGFYSINVPEGEYSIMVLKKGFVRSEKTTDVISGEISEVNFVLEPVE